LNDAKQLLFKGLRGDEKQVSHDDKNTGTDMKAFISQTNGGIKDYRLKTTGHIR